jgi:hypothetical protein
MPARFTYVAGCCTPLKVSVPVTVSLTRLDEIELKRALDDGVWLAGDGIVVQRETVAAAEHLHAGFEFADRHLLGQIGVGGDAVLHGQRDGGGVAGVAQAISVVIADGIGAEIAVGRLVIKRAVGVEVESRVVARAANEVGGELRLVGIGVVGEQAGGGDLQRGIEGGGIAVVVGHRVAGERQPHFERLKNAPVLGESTAD